MKRRRGSRPLVGSPPVFAGFRSPPEVMLLAVRWCLRHARSYRTWKSFSPSAASTGITSPSFGGCNASLPSSPIMLTQAQVRAYACLIVDPSIAAPPVGLS